MSIQDHAYIAAGSTITDPVESKTVAFGRAKQVNKQNYVPILQEKLKAYKK